MKEENMHTGKSPCSDNNDGNMPKTVPPQGSVGEKRQPQGSVVANFPLPINGEVRPMPKVDMSAVFQAARKKAERPDLSDEERAFIIDQIEKLEASMAENKCTRLHVARECLKHIRSMRSQVMRILLPIVLSMIM